jgi:phosphoglycerate kinase
MKTLKDIADNIPGKKVLMRVDFNVPLDKKTFAVTNDLRVRQALPTIRFTRERGGRTILMSHLGRPDGEVKPEFSMKKVADRLSALLGAPVKFAPDCIGPEVEKMVKGMANGQVLMLENLRFHAQEEENDECFSKQLAALGDYYVDDAFGTAHRAHASTEGVTHLMPSVAGLLIEKEVQYLSRVVNSPARPLVAVMGGAKVKDKVEAIRNLLKLADTLLIGGAMAYTFLKQQGKTIGKSSFEEDKLKLAGELLAEYAGKIVLPVDHVCAGEISAAAQAKTVDDVNIPEGLLGLDIGPKTARLYASRIEQAKTVTWNGPMGYFELDAFAEGTRSIARAMAKCKGVTIVGGGETGEAVEELGLQDKVGHISTGGGACLDFLAGKVLPGIKALE